PGFGLFVSANGSVTFSLARPNDSSTRDVLKLSFTGASASPTILGQNPLTSRSNYFGGGTAYTNVAQYGQVLVGNLYPGIDLVFHQANSGARQLQYDFVIHPGANPAAVQLSWQGATGVQTDAQGNLSIETAGQPLLESAPTLYQQAADGSHQPVSGG